MRETAGMASSSGRLICRPQDALDPLNHKACRALKTWLDVRPEGTDALFVTKFGQPLGPRAVQQLARKHMTKVCLTSAKVYASLPPSHHNLLPRLNSPKTRL
jgi:hypothetical protein